MAKGDRWRELADRMSNGEDFDESMIACRRLPRCLIAHYEREQAKFTQRLIEEEQRARKSCLTPTK